MATWVQTVNTPDGFLSDISHRHPDRGRSRRRELLVQKREVAAGRFLRVGKGYSRTAALCDLRVGFHNSASLVCPTREGCLSTIELRLTTILDEVNA